MRSMWKGAVSFGLVTIPVKMYSATEEKDVSFHQVRRSDGSRVRYRRVAEADGEEVAYGDIAKGYQLDNGETVILTDADFAELPLPTAHALDVLQFVPKDQLDPIYFNKSYYLEPEKQAAKPYVLLRDALERSDMVAVVKVAIRTREQLATMRVRDKVIVLETMLWPDEVRTPDFAFLDEKIELRPPENAMADSLVASMVSDFAPGEFTDDYRAALMEVIDAKAAGREVVEAPTEAPAAGTVVDLMAALRASVDAAKKRRGEVSSPDDDGGAEGIGIGPGDDRSAGPGETTAKNTAPAARSTAAKAAARKSPARVATGKASATKRAGVTKSGATKAAATKRAGVTKSGATKAAATKAAATKAVATKAAATKAAATKAVATKTAATKTAATKTAPGKKAPRNKARADGDAAGRRSA